MITEQCVEYKAFIIISIKYNIVKKDVFHIQFNRITKIQNIE